MYWQTEVFVPTFTVQDLEQEAKGRTSSASAVSQNRVETSIQRSHNMCNPKVTKCSVQLKKGGQTIKVNGITKQI